MFHTLFFARVLKWGFSTNHLRKCAYFGHSFFEIVYYKSIDYNSRNNAFFANVERTSNQHCLLRTFSKGQDIDYKVYKQQTHDKTFALNHKKLYICEKETDSLKTLELKRIPEHQGIFGGKDKSLLDRGFKNYSREVGLRHIVNCAEHRIAKVQELFQRSRIKTCRIDCATEFVIVQELFQRSRIKTRTRSKMSRS